MRRLSALVLSFLAAALVAGCAGDNESKSPANDRHAANNTAQRPSGNSDPTQITFSLPDPQGAYHTADEWIGKKPVVINFWGTWCGPCRREIPDMVKVYDEYKDRVEFLGIALNDTPEKVIAFTGQFNMDWVMLLGDAQVAGLFGIRGIPTTYFVDAQGRLVTVPDSDGSRVTHYVGPRDYNTFKQAIETVLANSKTSS